MPLELIELGKTGQCIQKRVCAFMLLELIELKKYRGAFRAKKVGGGGSQGTHTLLPFLSMGAPLSRESRVLTGPDSVMVRAFASEAGGAGSNHTKDVKNGTSGYLAWRSAFIRQALASLLSKKMPSVSRNTFPHRQCNYVGQQYCSGVL